MSRTLKIVLAVILVPVLLIGGLVLAIPYLVNVDTYRGKIQEKAEASLGRKVTIGQIRLSIFPLALRVEKLGVGEDPAFGAGDFATVDAVLVRVGLSALLDRKLDVQSVEAVEPSVHLIKNAKGEWNTDSLSQQKVNPTAAAGGAVASAPQYEIALLKLSNGKLTITDRSKHKATEQVFNNVNLSLDHLAPGKPVDFDLTVGIEPKGEIGMKGRAGPVTEGNPPRMPLTAHVKLDGVDIAKLTAPNTTTQGLLSGAFDIDHDGRTARADGTAKIERLQASLKGRPSAAPVEAKYEVEYTPASEVLHLRSVAVNVGSAVGHISGVVNRKTPPDSRLSIKADNAALVEIGKILPALGILLPNNATFASGTMTHTAELRGALDAPLNGQATLNVQKAKLNGYNIGEKVAAVAKFAGISMGGADTEIEVLKANANFVNGAATFTGIELTIPGISITGGGTMSAAGALDLKMNAVLSGAATQVLTRLGSSKGVPFIVRGTAQNPQFIPDVQGIVRDQIENRVGGDLGKALGGLFDRKKKN